MTETLVQEKRSAQPSLRELMREIAVVARQHAEKEATQARKERRLQRLRGEQP